MTEPRWVGWHRAYDEPGSFLHRRLAIVQEEIREVLASRRGELTRVVSMCAGQGRDLIGALRATGPDVSVEALLVELEPENVEAARAAITEADLSGITVVEADAGVADVYAGAVPADLVLVCGVFGNISDADIEHTIGSLPQLCAPGAGVVWTRHRRPPDLTPAIREWFTEAGFRQEVFVAPDDSFFTVGVARFQGTPRSLEPGERFFTFVGFDALTP
jgi:hypothetical protein